MVTVVKHLYLDYVLYPLPLQKKAKSLCEYTSINCSFYSTSPAMVVNCRDRASALVYDRARRLLLFNLSLLRSFELSRYSSDFGSVM